MPAERFNVVRDQHPCEDTGSTDTAWRTHSIQVCRRAFTHLTQTVRLQVPNIPVLCSKYTLGSGSPVLERD